MDEYKLEKIIAAIIVGIFIMLMLLVSFGIFSAFVYAICKLLGYTFTFEIGVALYLVVLVINLFINPLRCKI